MKGTAVVILDKKGRMLLLKRAMESQWMPGKWGLPGGKTEMNETTQQCAVRETEEETRLLVQNLQLLEEFSTAAVDVFIAPSYEGKVVLDFEHDDYAWVAYEDVQRYATTPRVPAIFRWVRKL